MEPSGVDWLIKHRCESGGDDGEAEVLKTLTGTVQVSPQGCGARRHLGSQTKRGSVVRICPRP